MELQREKIVAVLENEEAIISGSFCYSELERCNHAGRCAVGALLHAAGIPDVTLEGRGAANVEEYLALATHYGLTPDQTSGIIGCNDDFGVDGSGDPVEVVGFPLVWDMGAGWDGGNVINYKETLRPRNGPRVEEFDRLRAQHVVDFVKNELV